jgi:hypothetical protein
MGNQHLLDAPLCLGLTFHLVQMLGVQVAHY